MRVLESTLKPASVTVETALVAVGLIEIIAGPDTITPSWNVTVLRYNGFMLNVGEANCAFELTTKSAPFTDASAFRQP